MIRRIESRQDRFLHFDRKVVADAGDLVTDFLRRFGRVLFEHELHDDVREAVERVRRHPIDAADPADHFLDRFDHLALDGVGRRARIGDRHDDDGRVDFGEFVGVELHQRRDAKDDDPEHRHDRQNRALDCCV